MSIAGYFGEGSGNKSPYFLTKPSLHFYYLSYVAYPSINIASSWTKDDSIRYIQ